MKADFRNLQEVLAYVEDTLVIDLLQHAVSLEEDPYLIALNDPEPGVYVTGDIDPLINLNNRLYYRKKAYLTPEGEVKSYDDVINSNDDIVDTNATVVLSLKTIKTKKRFLNPQPTIPAIAIKVGVCVIQRYFNTLCHHLRRGYNAYKLENLVRPEYSDLIDKDEYLHGFEKLLDSVANFVDEDQWNLYFYKLKGTSMVITKGVDFRIYEYYRMQFEKDHVED